MLQSPVGWVDLSPYLFAAAARFAREAYEIEQQQRQGTAHPDDLLKSRILGGIMTACAGTEAFANEVLLRSKSSVAHDYGVKPETSQAIRVLWREIERLLR
jgi:hypothetical protein